MIDIIISTCLVSNMMVGAQVLTRGIGTGTIGGVIPGEGTGIGSGTVDTVNRRRVDSEVSQGVLGGESTSVIDDNTRSVVRTSETGIGGVVGTGVDNIGMGVDTDILPVVGGVETGVVQGATGIGGVGTGLETVGGLI